MPALHGVAPVGSPRPCLLRPCFDLGRNCTVRATLVVALAKHVGSPQGLKPMTHPPPASVYNPRGELWY